MANQTKARASTHPAGPPADDDRRGLRPPQFRLATMLWVIAALGILFAVMNSIGPIAAFALGMLMLCVLVHVVGNAVGTRLRELGNTPQPRADNERPRHAIVSAHEFAPATRLSRRQKLGWCLPVMLTLGFLIGAAAGGVWLAHVYGARATPMRLAIGGGAFGLIGAFLGFLGGALLQVLFLALWEALRASRTASKRQA